MSSYILNFSTRWRWVVRSD